MEKTFEENLEEMERIIASMERGELTLEDSVKGYQQGMQLYHVCQKKLLSAEKMLKVIEKDSNGVLKEKDFAEHEKQNGSETIHAFKEKTESKKRKKAEVPVEKGEGLSQESSQDPMELELF